jgi:hypothetical protein
MQGINQVLTAKYEIASGFNKWISTRPTSDYAKDLASSLSNSYINTLA